MLEVNGLLDMVRTRQGMRSDRTLAAALGVGSPAISNWRHGNSHPSPLACMRLAELANLPLGLVLGTIGEAYAPTAEEAAVWRKLANEARGLDARPKPHTPGPLPLQKSTTFNTGENGAFRRRR